ncbi:MAG: efflux transporter outer membrane subunit [Ectothiorhodospiraceae bacterium]|nr:efflux transporter outer membrane subunit [Ectothiorhodospiraceae bacterium]
MRRSFGAALIVALLAGCTLGPDYERPELLLPEEWPAEISGGMEEAPTAHARWWTRYQDPVLDRLIEEASDNNLDIGLAAARVAEARAIRGFRQAERYPTVDLFAEAEREDPGLTGGSIGNEFTVAAALNYEVDLWGRLSRDAEAARAELLATAYSRDAIQLAVITDVVSTYIAYRALSEQIQITESTIASRQESLDLERSRFDSGATTELATRQAEAELETSRAELPALRGEAAQLRRSLAILVGDSRAVLNGLNNLGDSGLPTLPDAMNKLPDLLPSELLERRPDIRAAEAFLIAANADIGVARAEWFPRVNLLGIFGTGATDAGDLFTGPSMLWELFGGLTAPILDFGRRQASVSSAEVRREMAEIQYRATILDAFREVGDAWTLLITADERLQARDREVSARVEVVRLAERRYAGGFSPYLEVLDARRALFDAELSRTAAGRDRLLAVAALYRALGGGWEQDDEQEALSGELAYD